MTARSSTTGPDSDLADDQPIRSVFDLTGRRAMVTGASRGLGLQMARALGRAGADLIITARDESSLAGPRAELESR
ncbi:MAG: SDR family NAD(P)-dependent oxidoreductase, partial [Planctomycetaceae bacterium]